MFEKCQDRIYQNVSEKVDMKTTEGSTQIQKIFKKCFGNEILEETPERKFFIQG